MSAFWQQLIGTAGWSVGKDTDGPLLGEMGGYRGRWEFGKGIPRLGDEFCPRVLPLRSTIPPTFSLEDGQNLVDRRWRAAVVG